MAGDIPHGRVKSDAREIRIQKNGPGKLNASLRIRRPCQFDLTTLSFRKLSKSERRIVQQVRVACQMLFIVVSLGQKPELVAAVIEPLARIRRKVLASELRIYEQVSVSGKGHLHQPSAILRNDDQLKPLVRELQRVPALIGDRV